MIVNLILPTISEVIKTDDELGNLNSIKPIKISDKNFGVFYSKDFFSAIITINLEQQELIDLKKNSEIIEITDKNLKSKENDFKIIYPNFNFDLLRKRLYGSHSL